jgi:uncharacterized protein (UPF0297 family)
MFQTVLSDDVMLYKGYAECNQILIYVYCKDCSYVV